MYIAYSGTGPVVALENSDTEVPSSQMNSGCHNRSTQPSLLQLCDVCEIDSLTMGISKAEMHSLAIPGLCEISEQLCTPVTRPRRCQDTALAVHRAQANYLQRFGSLRSRPAQKKRRPLLLLPAGAVK